MSCSITINPTATAVPVGGTLQITVSGTATECPADVVDVTVVCHHGTAEVPLLTHARVPVAMGIWSAMATVSAPQQECDCGDTLHVEAYCVSDETCSSGWVPVTVECVCWAVDASWSWCDAMCNPLSSPRCVDGNCYVQFKITLTPPPPPYCSPLTIVLDYGDTPSGSTAPSCAVPGTGWFTGGVSCGPTSTYDCTSTSTPPPIPAHAYLASGTGIGATYHPKLLICNPPPGCPEEIDLLPITVLDCPSCPTPTATLITETYCDDSRCNGSVTAYAQNISPSGYIASFTFTDVTDPAHPKSISQGPNTGPTPGPGGHHYDDSATTSMGLCTGTTVEVTLKVSPPSGSSCTKSASAFGSPANVEIGQCTSRPPDGCGCCSCTMLLWLAFALFLASVILAALAVCLMNPIIGGVAAILFALSVIAYVIWAWLCARASSNSCQLLNVLECVISWIIAITPILAILVGLLTKDFLCGLAVLATDVEWGLFLVAINETEKALGCPRGQSCFGIPSPSTGSSSSGESPSSVRSGRAKRGRLLETLSGRAFIFFVTSIKQDDIPGFEPDLTEEGSSGVPKD